MIADDSIDPVAKFADEIDNPPDGVVWYEMAATMLTRINGLARAANPSEFTSAASDIVSP